MKLGVLQALEVVAGAYLIIEAGLSMAVFRDQLMLYQAARAVRLLIGIYLVGHNLMELAFISSGMRRMTAGVM